MTALRFLLGLSMTVAPLAACQDESTTGLPVGGRFYGPSTAVGNGVVRTYIIHHDSQMTELGVALSEAALAGLPDQMLMHHLPFPTRAEGMPFTFMMFGWNPQGHVPAPTYTLPHFDFHFYLMSESDMMDVPGGPDPMLPEPSLIPQGYFAPGNVSVPGMGVHWIARSAPEMNGELFDKTMIYGFTGGRLAFIEPMITKAFLETKQDYATEIAQPARFGTPGLYPTNYSIRYDASAREYRIAVGGFARR